MRTLKETLDGAGTWMSIGLLVSVGWQLGALMGRDVYKSVNWVIDKCVEKLDK